MSDTVPHSKLLFNLFTLSDTFIFLTKHFILYRRLPIQLFFTQYLSNTHTLPLFLVVAPSKKSPQKHFRLAVVARIYHLQFLSEFLLGAERIRGRNATPEV